MPLITRRVTIGSVIQSFADSVTARVWGRRRAKGLGPDLQRMAYRTLLLIDAAGELEDLRMPPGNHLEKLKGSRVGFHGIRINDQWRVCFRWTSAGPTEVEIVDYH